MLTACGFLSAEPWSNDDSNDSFGVTFTVVSRTWRQYEVLLLTDIHSFVNSEPRVHLSRYRE